MDELRETHKMDEHDKVDFCRWGRRAYAWGDQTVKQYESMLDRIAEYIEATNPRWVTVTKVQEVRLNDDAQRDIEIASIREIGYTRRALIYAVAITSASWLLLSTIFG